MPKSKTKIGARIPLSIRTTRRIYGIVEDAARESGRSMSQEVEFILERSFWLDELLGDEPRDQSHPMVL